MNGVLIPLQLVSFSLALPYFEAFFFLSIFIYGYDDVERESESFQLFLFFKLNVTSFRFICALDTLSVFSLIIQHVFNFILVLLANFFVIYEIYLDVFLIFYDDDSFRLMILAILLLI